MGPQSVHLYCSSHIWLLHIVLSQGYSGGSTAKRNSPVSFLTKNGPQGGKPY